MVTSVHVCMIRDDGAGNNNNAGRSRNEMRLTSAESRSSCRKRQNRQSVPVVAHTLLTDLICLSPPDASLSLRPYLHFQTNGMLPEQEQE